MKSEINENNSTFEEKTISKSNNNLFGGLAVSALLLVGVFTTSVLLQNQQDIRQHASETTRTISYLAFNPAGINLTAASIASKTRVNMSVLAYDSSNNPLYDLATYEWGISSTNSVGTIEKSNGTIATFLAQNIGRGDIYVTAHYGTQTITQSIPVSIGSETFTPTPTASPTPIPPTPTPSNTPTPTPPDTTSPQVSITYPLAGTNVLSKTTVNITAAASDISGIARVEFFINGVLTCTDSAAVYNCSWKVPNAKNKAYVIAAKAYDTVGNISTASISVKSK